MEAKFNLLLVTALLFPFFSPFRRRTQNPLNFFFYPFPFEFAATYYTRYWVHPVLHKGGGEEPRGYFFTFQEWIVPCQGAQ